MIEDIRYLIVFAKVVETGSFRAGAESLDLSTAAASLHVSKLENNLGVALLYRNTRKLSLTSDGENLFETAKEMLSLYEKGVIEFKQRVITTSNNLKISIPAVFVNSPFMQRIGEFVKEHPEVRLNILCSDNRNDIIAESIDVAFRIGNMPDSSLKAKHIFAFPRKVVASTKFLQRFPSLEHPKDLQDVPWIGLTMRPNSRTFRNAAGEQVDIKYAPQVYVDNVEAAYSLAREGVGLAAPPEYLAREHLDTGKVEEVLQDWSIEPLKVYAVWPPNMSTNSLAYRLINSIGEL